MFHTDASKSGAVRRVNLAAEALRVDVPRRLHIGPG